MMLMLLSCISLGTEQKKMEDILLQQISRPMR